VVKKWIDVLVQRPTLVVVLAAAVAAAGGLAWLRLPLDAFPDVTGVQVMILAESPGLAPEDVERRVTYSLEQGLLGLPRATGMRSLSRPGLSQVVVTFEEGTDPYFARQVVFERLQEAREHLPAGTDVELAPLATGLGEIFQYTVEGEGYSAMERRSLQDYVIAPRLRMVPGVTEVNSFGGEVRQLHVIVHPERLMAYDLTLADVERAVTQADAASAGGLMVRGWEQFLIRTVGLLENPEQVAAAVVRAESGAPVLVRDVADVVIGAQIRQGAVTRDGKGETVAGMAIMLRGANSRTVVAAVKREIESLAPALPDGVSIDVFYDRTELIQACIRTVASALAVGGVLVLVILFLVLAEVRTAAVVMLSLPLSFAISFLLMGWAGVTANLMSLGGLAFAVGMVVDGSIVIAENIRRRLAAAEERFSLVDVVTEGAAEVVRPVIFSILVVALMVIPLLLLGGMEGAMFRPLALALLFSLVASLLVALLFVPAISKLLLRFRDEREFRWVRAVRRSYLGLLERALDHPRVVLGAAGIALVVAAVLAPGLGSDFLPPLDEGALAVNAVRLPNASLDGSVATAGMIERRVLAHPEVATVVTKTGRAEISEDPMGPEQSDVFIMFEPRRWRQAGRSREVLLAEIEKDFASIPGLRAAFSQPIALRVNELVSGVKGDLAVKVFGDDLDQMKQVADRIAAIVAGVPGAVDVGVEQVAGMTEVRVNLDRGAMSRWGLSVAEVSEFLNTALAGRVAAELLEGERRTAVVVWFPANVRRSIDDLSRLLVDTPAGARVPLGELARLEEAEGPAQISREEGRRRVVIEANVRGRDLGGFVAEVKQRLAPVLSELPPGSYVRFGGQFEQRQRAMARLAVGVPIVLLVMVLLLVASLGGARDAMLVLVNLPFAMVGGVIAAAAFGVTLSISAAAAFIVLLGIAVQNGMVLMTFFGQLRRQVDDPRERVIKACEMRFRPLVMTALTSFIGYLPLALVRGPGADIQRPLAVVLMGGIVTSSLLTLVVLPVLYARLEKRDRGTVTGQG